MYSLQRATCTGALRLPRALPSQHRPGRSSRLLALPPCRSSAAASEQLSQVAARLSTVRCRELLAASCVELLKTALVGSTAASAAPEASAAADDGSSGPPASPEAMLDALHASLQASLQDAAHQVASEHQDAWLGVNQWEAFQAAHAVVQRLLFDLHSQAASAGCAAGELQVARCLEYGMLVPQDATAAFHHYQRAAAMGSAEAALRCGIHHFEGTAPGGRDGAKAFDFFSRALDLLTDGGGGQTSGGWAPLAPPTPDTAVEGDVPEPLSAEEVRYSTLTWMGRCHMEGAGVERSVKQAAACFRQAGNEAELAEIAALKMQFAQIDDADLHMG